jgi:hypothetical protein
MIVSVKFFIYKEANMKEAIIKYPRDCEAEYKEEGLVKI